MNMLIDELEHMKNRSGVMLPEEGKRALAAIREAFNRERQRVRYAEDQENYIANSIYLNPEIAAEGWDDPIGTADRMLDKALIQIFRGAGRSTIAEGELHRLRNLQTVLFDPSFDEHRMRMFFPDGREFTEQERQRVLEARRRFQTLSSAQKERFARSFTIRYKAAQFWEKWKDAAALNDKDYQLYINSQFDEDDFFGLDFQYGGLVGRFRRSLAKNYAKYIFDENGQRRGMDPTWWTQALEDTKAEMVKGNNKRDRERYRLYRGGEFFKSRIGSQEVATLRPHTELDVNELEKDYKEAVRAIGDLANVRMIMSFEKYNIDARFAPPKWSQSQQDIASDFLEKQKIVRLSHPYENHLMQWNTFGSGKTELERANIRHRAEIWLETMPEAREYGNQWAEEVWERIESCKRGGWTPDQERVLFGQIDCLFYFTPDPLRRPPDPVMSREKMAAWIKKLSKEHLQKEVQIYSGMQLSQRFDNDPYFVMFESGYRRGSENRFLSDAIKVMNDVVRETGAEGITKDGVFDAGKLVGATLKYKGAFTSGEAHELTFGEEDDAKKGFLREISSIAHTRPHDLVLALKEGHSRSLAGVEEQLVENRPGKFMRSYSEIAASYEEIRDELLENKFHKQIDYHSGIAGLDDVQRRVATEWFRERYGDHADEEMQWYFGTMERMSKYLLDPPAGTVPVAAHKPGKLEYILIGNIRRTEGTSHYGALTELGNPGYIPLLSKARWDDFPYEWLQEPERILGMMDPEHRLSDSALRRISDRFIGEYGGDEQSGPCRRMHRDAGGAQDGFDLTWKTMLPDDEIHGKILREAITGKYQKIMSYQGADAAAISMDTAIGARARTEKVLPTHGPFFEKMRGACEMSKYGFPQAKAKSADELHESMLKDRSETYGVMMNVPSAESIIESSDKVSGVSNWRTIFKAMDWIPGLGQAKRGVEVAVGPKKWARIIEYLDSRFATKVVAHKGMMSVPYIALLIGVYIMTQLSQGEKKESGGHK